MEVTDVTIETYEVHDGDFYCIKTTSHKSDEAICVYIPRKAAIQIAKEILETLSGKKFR